jgi:hypothetical protein
MISALKETLTRKDTTCPCCGKICRDITYRMFSLYTCKDKYIYIYLTCEGCRYHRHLHEAEYTLTYISQSIAEWNQRAAQAVETWWLTRLAIDVLFPRDIAGYMKQYVLSAPYRFIYRWPKV